MPRGKNTKLKKSHVETEYTSDQFKELQKCIADPIYFIKTYVKIIHPVEGQILFNLFYYQETMIHNFLNHRFCINLLPRQVGKTECISAYLLWFALYNSDKTILITSNKSENAMEIIAKIQNAYEELPHWLKPGIDEKSWNKHTCTFDNKSRILSTATSETTGRTFSASLVYCDEYAFVAEHIQEAFWTSIYPVLSTGGACIISSTPNGDTNKFAELWRGAELGTNTFCPFTVAWNARPGRDEAFKQEVIANFGAQKWKQEYECKFISTDHTLVNTELVSELEKELLSFKPAFTMPNDNGYEPQVFFRKIDRDSTYLVGVDPGTGTGSDYSVIQVIEFPRMLQVMEFRTNSVSHVEIYNYLKKILTFLEHLAKEVYWTVENNGVGQAIVALFEADEKAPQKASFMSEPGAIKKGGGMFTTDKNKMEACLLLKSMFENKILTFYSPIILKELKNYKRAKGAYEAKTGATDDCISATLLTLRLLKEIAVYDDRAYHKLYTINLGDSSDEWVKEIYKENDDYDENEVPPPMGLI